MNLDHVRARSAHMQLCAIKQNRASVVGVLKDGPIRVRQLGLLQTSVLWLAKAWDKKNDEWTEYKTAFELLFDWLIYQSPSTQSLIRSKPGRIDFDKPEEMLTALFAQNSQVWAQLEREAEAYLVWLSRVGDALTKEAA